jgi:hypothetical protein
VVRGNQPKSVEWSAVFGSLDGGGSLKTI